MSIHFRSKDWNFLIMLLTKLVIVQLFFNYSVLTAQQTDNQKKMNETQMEKPGSAKKLLTWQSQFEYMPAKDFNAIAGKTLLEFNAFQLFNSQFKIGTSFSYQYTDENSGYFPQDLYDSKWFITGEGRDILVYLRIGSIRNKPYHSVDELYYSGLIAYNILNSRQHYLYVGLLYSSRIGFLPDHVDDYPLPYMIYLYQSRDFVLILPFPLMARWQISGQLASELNYDLNKTKLAFTVHNIARNLDLSIEGYYHYQGIYIADRTDKNELLCLEGFKAGLRLSYLFVNAFVGYAFEQSYSLVKQDGFFSSTSQNKQSIDDSVIFDIQLKLEF